VKQGDQAHVLEVLALHPEPFGDLDRELDHVVGMRGGIGIPGGDRGDQGLDRGRLDLEHPGALLHRVALELVGDHAREDVEELEVAVPDVGAPVVAGGAERSEERAVGEVERNRDEGPDPGRLGHGERGRHRLVGDHRDQAGQLTIEHLLAIGVGRGHHRALLHPERGPVAAQGAEDLLPAGHLGGVGDVEPEELADRFDRSADRLGPRAGEGAQRLGAGRAAVGQAGYCGGRLHP
jgi:hypothetical protein